MLASHLIIYYNIILLLLRKPHKRNVLKKHMHNLVMRLCLQQAHIIKFCNSCWVSNIRFGYATPVPALRLDSLTLLIQSAKRLHQSLDRRPLQERINIIITTDTDHCMLDSSRKEDRWYFVIYEPMLMMSMMFSQVRGCKGMNTKINH